MFIVYGSGFRVWSLTFVDSGSGIRFQDLGFRAWIYGFRVYVLGFDGQGLSVEG